MYNSFPGQQNMEFIIFGLIIEKFQQFWSRKAQFYWFIECNFLFLVMKPLKEA